MEQLRITDTPAGPISYLLTRKRVKNLNLRVRNGQVSLSMPLGCPAEEADAMVRAKCRWIIQALERQWAPGPELPPEPTACWWRYMTARPPPCPTEHRR
mgnify:CR=1 FL=1